MQKTMTRAELANLGAIERASKINTGFRIVDPKPTPKPRPPLVGKALTREDWDAIGPIECARKIHDGYRIVD
jgi:hypothetical protein